MREFFLVFFSAWYYLSEKFHIFFLTMIATLTTTLAVLQLCRSITMPWLWITAPLWIPILFVIVSVLVLLGIGEPK